MRTNELITFALVFLSTLTQTFGLDCVSCTTSDMDDSPFTCFNAPSSEIDIEGTVGVQSSTCDSGEVCRVVAYYGDNGLENLERGCFDSETFCGGNTNVANECDDKHANCYQCCDEDYCNTDVPDTADTIPKLTIFGVLTTSIISIALVVT
uniref:Uncharacterized protein LOC100376311 n=1 Tax=Saccoglossus kowalevskii TaxID=10224 RepID=A0ABM0GLU1_SACKO|nr:PREDICTED: uncharacterized protein LOC100376311 [Saccoglossus kowalevskii]